MEGPDPTQQAESLGYVSKATEGFRTQKGYREMTRPKKSKPQWPDAHYTYDPSRPANMPVPSQAPRPPRPTRPDPSVAVTGARPCNAPITIGDRTYYCERWNRLYRHWWGLRNWSRPHKPHDGPHRLEWWS